MAGRYRLETDWTEIVRVFELDLVSPLDVAPQLNAAPTMRMPVVLMADARRTARIMHWGLLSPWSKFREAARTINARCETVHESRTFAAAFRERRALVPADGFYEWRKDGGGKTPVLLRHPGGPLAFAGLWQRWWDPKLLKDVDTFTIVTCPPNATVSPVHDRMPVILPPDAWAKWLSVDTGPEEARALLVPAAENVLAVENVVLDLSRPGRQGTA